jgi:pimeloyl-ACP methyl ester carboxylesterase
LTAYDEHFYTSRDGLRLYARDYPHAEPRATILCLHGLSRNSADFAQMCETLNDEYRLIAVDQRGRGKSAYDPNPENYNPLVYSRDMFDLLDHLGLGQVIVIGTSMGGVISMVMGSMDNTRFRAVVLNDIGPVIDPSGLARIRAYVGQLEPVNTWADAEAQVAATNAIAFPDYSAAEWGRFARNVYREDENGRPVIAHDPAIAGSLRDRADAPAVPDLWPAFDVLSDVPILVVRGETSDILAPGCVTEMRRRRPDLEAVEISGRGHAPMLDEPAAIAALRNFLARVA